MTFIIIWTHLTLIKKAAATPQRTHNRRLKKFRPDLLEKVEKGERKAEFNPDSSKSVINAILRHYDKQQIQYIIGKLNEAVEGDNNNDL